MAIPWAAIESDGFILLNGATDTATGVDTAVVRGGVSVGIGQQASSPVFAAVPDCWHHFEFFQSGLGVPAGNAVTYALLSNIGSQLVRIVFNGGNPGVSALQYWNGSAWVTAYTWTSQSVRLEFDIRVKSGALGKFELYANKTQIVTADIDHSAHSGIVQVIYPNPNSIAHSYINSQNIISDLPTVGFKAYRNPLVANGVHTAWTGAVGDINEATLNDATFLNTATAGAKRSFTQSTPPTLPQGTVIALVDTMRARTDGVTPNKIRNGRRRAGTDYYGATYNYAGVGFEPICTPWMVDPSTGVAWTPANAVAVANELITEAIA